MKFINGKSGRVGISVVALLTSVTALLIALPAMARWIEIVTWVETNRYWDPTNGVEVVEGYYDFQKVWVPDENGTTEPIDTASGNNYFREERIFVPCPGVGMDMKVDLFYGSITNRTTGRLGLGWHHSYEWGLLVQSDQVVLEKADDQLVFTKNTNGLYTPPASHNWTMEETPSGYEVGMSGGLAYEFGTNGTLSAIHDAWGNRVDCSYATNGCLEAVTHANGGQILFSNVWNAAISDWRVASISVPGGEALAFGYNGDGQLAQVVEQVGANNFTSSYQYADGFLTNKINGAGFEYSFGYEEESGVRTGRGTYLAVDGYYEHEVDYAEQGNYTDVAYHRRGTNQIFRYSRSESGVLEAVYGPSESIQDIEQRGTRYRYSTNGVDKTETTLFDNGALSSEWMQYDDAHNLTNFSVSYGTTNPTLRVSLEYDPVWQLPSVAENADDLRVEKVYTNGLPLVEKAFYSESNSYDTCYSYTTNGLVLAITNANSHVVRFGHDAMGNKVSAAAEIGPTVTNTFDALGFMASTELLSETGASTGRIVQYSRNAKGWIEQVLYPDGSSSSYAYNALGYLTNSIDRAGRMASYTYAPTRKLTSVTKYLKQGGSIVPVRTGFDRDEQVNVLRIAEPRGRYVESYQLDIQDRVTSITNIEDQAMVIDYSVGDFISRVSRFDGSAITNEYDSAGRVTNVVYSSSTGTPVATIAASYHPDGKIESISDGISTVSNRFDRLNRLTRRQSLNPSLEYSVYYSPDPIGNITSSEAFYYRNSWQWISIHTDFTYDEAERLETRGSHAFTYSTENGLLSTVSNTVDGITCSYAYDIMNRATNITYRAGDGTLIRSLDYAYDAASMITNKTELQVSGFKSQVSYAYDTLNRLVGESTSTNGSFLFDIHYSYDLAGNRLTKTTDGIGVAYTLGDGNRLASARTIGVIDMQGSSTEPIGTDDRWGELYVSNITANVGWVPETDGLNFWADNMPLELGTNQLVAALRDQAGNTDYTTNSVILSAASTNMQYAYDAAGCMTNLDGTSLQWDERYRLTNATVRSASSTSTVSYAYDVLDRRASRTVNGATEHYLWEGNQIIADLYGNLWYHRIYAYGPGIDNILTMTVYPSDGNVNAAVTYHYIKDHQNSVIALTDAGGTVLETYAYDAYGGTRVFDTNGVELAESAYGNRFCFQGREIDWDTGLYYFRARWYDPATGRWLSKDPKGIAGGLNQYVFVGDNPINFVDPKGLKGMGEYAPDVVEYWLDWWKDTHTPYDPDHGQTVINADPKYPNKPPPPDPPDSPDSPDDLNPPPVKPKPE